MGLWGLSQVQYSRSRQLHSQSSTEVIRGSLEGKHAEQHEPWARLRHTMRRRGVKRAIHWADVSEDQTRSPSRYVCRTCGMYSPPSRMLPEYTTKSARRPGLHNAKPLICLLY